MKESVETRLKALVRERHWTYSSFCREYDRTAGSVAPELTGTAPSRAQLHRWISGQLKGLPFPDHCHVLEKMFPGWTARQLFEPVDSSDPIEGPMIDRLVQLISPILVRAGGAHGGWGPLATPAGGGRSLLQQPDSGTVLAIAKRLMALERLLRLDATETTQLAGLAGSVVELSRTVEIVIDAKNRAAVSYRHELFNMTDHPVTRLSRELWFQRAAGPLRIEAADGSRRVAIERTHDAGSLAKFSCRISPGISPGEIVTVGYCCTGGMIDGELFWRQSIVHYTRHLTITVQHHGIGDFLGATAVEEQPDGAVSSASDGLLSDYDGETALLTFTRDYLRPGHAVTVRWECE